MALSPEQLEVVREIVDTLSLEEITRLCAALDSVREQATADDVDLWQAERRKFDKRAKVDGKVKLDPSDEEKAIRRRVRSRLGVGSTMPTFFASTGGCRR